MPLTHSPCRPQPCASALCTGSLCSWGQLRALLGIGVTNPWGCQEHIEEVTLQRTTSGDVPKASFPSCWETVTVGPRQCPTASKTPPAALTYRWHPPASCQPQWWQRALDSSSQCGSPWQGGGLSAGGELGCLCSPGRAAASPRSPASLHHHGNTG